MNVLPGALYNAFCDIYCVLYSYINSCYLHPKPAFTPYPECRDLNEGFG